MKIGGVILGAGMILHIAPGDYLYGSGPVRFMLARVIETRRDWNADWVIMEGIEQPSPAQGWRPRRIQVRVSALEGALRLADA